MPENRGKGHRSPSNPKQDDPTSELASTTKEIRTLAQAFTTFANEQKAREDKADIQNAKKTITEGRTLFWIGLYTAITGIILFVGIYQAYVAHESLASVQRAFIDLKGFDIESRAHYLIVRQNFGNQDNSFSWFIEPIWENSGSTPTRNLRIYNAAPITRNIAPNTPVSDPMIDFKIPKDSDLISTFIPPRGEASASIEYANNDLLRDIQDQKLEAFLWGEATYEDAFQNWLTWLLGPYQHVTRYCYRIYGLAGDISDPSASIRLQYRQCRGNCTDEECSRQPSPDEEGDTFTMVINRPPSAAHSP
jgi:hypothetical protein